MPSVNLKKSEKMEALGEMTRAKFLGKYNDLMRRRAVLALAVYDDTDGKMGNKLEAQAGKDFQLWCDTTGSLEVDGLEVPHLLIENSKKSAYASSYIDFFTRKKDRSIDPHNFSQTLSRTVVKPNRCYGWTLDVTKATAKVKAKVKTFNRDAKSFCEEVHKFYYSAASVLEYIRTSKQVDERFPELWEFLPDGLRERIKQAVVLVDQDAIDAVRSEVKDTKKIR